MSEKEGLLIEILSPVELLSARRIQMFKEALIAETKTRNRIKKMIPEYENAIEKLTPKVGIFKDEITEVVFEETPLRKFELEMFDKYITLNDLIVFMNKDEQNELLKLSK